MIAANVIYCVLKPRVSNFLFLEKSGFGFGTSTEIRTADIEQKIWVLVVTLRKITGGRKMNFYRKYMHECFVFNVDRRIYITLHHGTQTQPLFSFYCKCFQKIMCYLQKIQPCVKKQGW